jgi:Na+/phosphate symporter
LFSGPGRHVGHRCEPIKLALESIQDKLKSYNVQLNSKLQSIQTILERAAEIETRIQQESIRLEKNSVDKINQLRAILDEKQRILIEEIKREEREKLRQLVDR